MSVVHYTVPAHTRTYKTGKTVLVAEFVASRVVQSARRVTEKLITRSRHIAIGAEKLKKYQAKKQAKKAFIASLPPIQYNYSLMNDEKAVFTFECEPEVVEAPKPKKAEKGIFVHYDCYHFDYNFIREKFSSDFSASEMKDILRRCRKDGGSMVHSFCPSNSRSGYTYNEGFIFEGVRGKRYIATCYGINTSSSFACELGYRQYESFCDDDDEYNPSTFYSQTEFKKRFGIKIPAECDLQTRK
jgi:hypothetical protein